MYENINHSKYSINQQKQLQNKTNNVLKIINSIQDDYDILHNEYECNFNYYKKHLCDCHSTNYFNYLNDQYEQLIQLTTQINNKDITIKYKKNKSPIALHLTCEFLVNYIIFSYKNNKKCDNNEKINEFKYSIIMVWY